MGDIESDNSFDPEKSDNEYELQLQILALKNRVFQLQKEDHENKQIIANLRFVVGSMQESANIHTQLIRTLRAQVRIWKDFITAQNTATTLSERVARSGPRAVQDT